MNHLSVLLFGVLFCIQVHVRGAEVPPPPVQTLSAAVEEMWKEKKMAELDRYIVSLVAKYPKYVPVLVLGAFHDVTFRGDVAASEQKLASIQAGIDSGQINGGDEFATRLLLARHTNAQLFQHMAKEGLTAEQVQREAKGPASALGLREMLSELNMLPEEFALTRSSPAATLP